MFISSVILSWEIIFILFLSNLIPSIDFWSILKFNWHENLIALNILKGSSEKVFRGSIVVLINLFLISSNPLNLSIISPQLSWFKQIPIEWFKNLGAVEISGGEPLYQEDALEFLELEFSPVAANTNYTSNTITYDSFKTFAIKIVMLSADTTKVPLIKDLRIIALA